MEFQTSPLEVKKWPKKCFIPNKKGKKTLANSVGAQSPFGGPKEGGWYPHLPPPK